MFWVFPAVLSFGRKGKMIKEVKHQLGIIASKMWKDAKTNCDSEDEDKSLLSNMRNTNSSIAIFFRLSDSQDVVRTAKSSTVSMTEEEIVSQMRTVISAGYETVSAVIAASFTNHFQ